MSNNHREPLIEITEAELNDVQEFMLRPRTLYIRSAPRMTQGTKHNADNQNYLQYKFAIKHLCKVKQFNPHGRPVHVVFSLPVPKGKAGLLNQSPYLTIHHGGKKVDVGLDRHEAKPDTDNLLKAFFDAVHEKDQMVGTMVASKHWGTTGYIRVYALSDSVLAELYNQK